MRKALRRLTSLVAVGALAGTALVLSPGVAQADPVAFAVAAGINACQFGTVDLATGEFTAIGASDSALCVFDLTVAPDGTVYGIRLEPDAPAAGSPWFLQTIDPATGAVTASEAIGPDGNDDGGEGGGVAVDPAGALFAEYVPGEGPPAEPCTAINYCLASVDPANPGAATIIGPAEPEFTIVESLTISCAGEAFVTSAVFAPGSTDQPAGWPDVGAEELTDADLSSVDLATGAISTIGAYGGGNVITGHDVDTAGALWGVGFQPTGLPSTFTIDASTGAATAVAPLSGPLFAIAIDHPCAAPPTPEPVVIQPTFTG